MSLLWIPVYEPISVLASGATEFICVDLTASILSPHQEDIYAYRFDWDDEPGPFGFLIGHIHVRIGPSFLTLDPHSRLRLGAGVLRRFR
jgi:hypothetical protein